MIDRASLLAALDHCVTESHLPLPGRRAGKVRDSYEVGESTLLLVTTDRQSGFDRMLGHIPFKGQVLNRTSAHWFRETAHLVPNHALAVPHANALLARRCEVLPIEFVVRGYLTGSTDTSIWTQYAAGTRQFGGITLPDGMRKNQLLPRALLTPTTKEATHDRPITPGEIVREGWMTAEHWATASAYALDLFRFGQQRTAERGLMLVDTKYEFGLDSAGQVRLIDEVHTPDSSRYWIAESYETRMTEGREPDMIDKEFFRLWFRERCDPYADAALPVPPAEIVVELASRYIELFERISGEAFVPDTRPLVETVMAALAAESAS